MYCSGTDPDKKRSFRSGELILELRFLIEKTEDAAPDAKGVLGDHDKGAITFSADLLVKEGCSAKYSCVADKTGYELCQFET